MSRAQVLGVVVVAGAGLLLGAGSAVRPAAVSRLPVGPTLRVDAAPPSRGVEARPGVGPGGGMTTRAVQADPERLDPALAREHRRLLGERPVLQHLPYRDRRIGVNLDRVLGGGRIELLVTYLGSRARAVGDLRRLLGRYGDPGTA